MSKQIQARAGMLNDEGQVVDIYVPRKCDYTNKILNSADKSSIQINIGEVCVYNNPRSTSTANTPERTRLLCYQDT